MRCGSHSALRTGKALPGTVRGHHPPGTAPHGSAAAPLPFHGSAVLPRCRSSRRAGAARIPDRFCPSAVHGVLHAVFRLRSRARRLRPGHVRVHAVRPAVGHLRGPARLHSRRGAADLGLRRGHGHRGARDGAPGPELAAPPCPVVLPLRLRRRARRRCGHLQLRGAAGDASRRGGGQCRVLGRRPGHRGRPGRTRGTSAGHVRGGRRCHRRLCGGGARRSVAGRSVGVACGVLGRGPRRAAGARRDRGDDSGGAARGHSAERVRRTADPCRAPAAPDPAHKRARPGSDVLRVLLPRTRRPGHHGTRRRVGARPARSVRCGLVHRGRRLWPGHRLPAARPDRGRPGGPHPRVGSVRFGRRQPWRWFRSSSSRACSRSAPGPR